MPEIDLSIIEFLANAGKYHHIIKDMYGWLNKELREAQYYDKETIEYCLDKLHEIAINYQIEL